MNGSNFAKDLNKFGSVFLPKRSGEFFRKVTLAAYQGCITTSPVDTGRFRLNWRVSINSINASVSAVVNSATPTLHSPPLSAEISASGINMAMNDLKTNQNVNAIYISNNLPYAASLENGNSDQAPNGIIKLVAQQLKYKLGNI